MFVAHLHISDPDLSCHKNVLQNNTRFYPLSRPQLLKKMNLKFHLLFLLIVALFYSSAAMPVAQSGGNVIESSATGPPGGTGKRGFLCGKNNCLHVRICGFGICISRGPRRQQRAAAENGLGIELGRLRTTDEIGSGALLTIGCGGGDNPCATEPPALGDSLSER